MINTPEYKLAKFLDWIIKPYMPKSYAVTSNDEFLKKLKGFYQQEGDQCVSFDVVSLFTNVPLEETIDIIADKLWCNPTDSPPMPKHSFISLMKWATSGMFSYKDQLYQQCDGVAMGNPLAPTLANFFMGHVEERLFQHTNDKSYPALYLR